MATSCSLVVVNYHSSALAAAAIRTARAATQNPLQVIAVDNSADATEAAALRPHADVLVVAETNLGYGAAVNRARAKCDGDVLLVCNPDVQFEAGSIDLLIATDADVAGPALFWDDAFQWFLPPSDLHFSGEAIDAALASRFARWRRNRDRDRIRKRIAFWTLRETTPVRAISGAVMAIRRSAFDRIGGFDERFHLYFEEIDFQRRLPAGSVAYVPKARCRHLYNQSAGRSPDSAAEYARSEMQYLEKWSGEVFAKGIKRLERRPLPPAAQRLTDAIQIDRPNVVIEASPLASFDTAAGHFPTRPDAAIPSEVWQSYQGDALYLRVVDRDSARVIATYVKTRITA
ncbi:MAG: glycosyltransferase [Acidobacteriota bacterium]|nr:glycosyltransferase [Acidobacteriota bacterium]